MKTLKRLHGSLAICGLNLKQIVFSIRGLPLFLRDFLRYRRASEGLSPSFRIRLSDLFPVLSDRYGSAGVAKGHYFFQDLWVAKIIYKTMPSRHVDIGSSVEGFVSHLLVFMNRIEVVDIRSLQSTVPELSFVQDDATHLANFEDCSLESISSLHAAEHFGLGRYGDPIDPNAHLKFMHSLKRVLKPGGFLYFSVPTGVERIEFNAHRIFSPGTILSAFEGLELIRFALIKDDGYLYEDATMEEARKQIFGCGLYVFTKH